MQAAARWRRAGLFMLPVFALGALGVWLSAPQLRPGPPAPIALTIALPVQVSTSAVYVAKQRGMFTRHGITATLQAFLLGRQGLQSVLDGKADLALVADTPFVLAVLRGERITTLGTVFASRKTMAIYALRQNGITDVASLSGKRIATVAGTNAEFFLDNMLDMAGIARSAATVVKLNPEQLIDALRTGQVDAVTVWNPDLARLEQQFGSAGVTIYGEDLFVYRFLLVGKQSTIAAKPEAVRRVLLSLRDANQFIKAHPDATRAIIGQAVGLPAALLARSFNASDFNLVLDQSLLLALSEQTRWAQQKQLVSGPMPNYLDFVSRAPLRAIAPDADKIIR